LWSRGSWVQVPSLAPVDGRAAGAGARFSPALFQLWANRFEVVAWTYFECRALRAVATAGFSSTAGL
ncbi:MAG: hypothetical protein ACXW36_11265, partial [Nitrospira sp.]